MATYLECRDDLQFQHGPIEVLSSIDTWDDVHSLPIAISNPLDLLIISIKNVLYVYKCSKYSSALITKSRDMAKGEFEIEKSLVKIIYLSDNILSISINHTSSLLLYQLVSDEAGVYDLQNLNKAAVKLPNLQCYSWSGNKLLCFKDKFSIYNFEDYKGELPDVIECTPPELSGKICISGLESSQSSWAVGHSNPPFFFTITSQGVVSQTFPVTTEEECNCKLAGICQISPDEVLTALLIKTDSCIDSAISLYSINSDQGTSTSKHFTVENELFIQDENFGETLADPFNGTVKFLNFQELGIVFAIGSHTSQALILGYGEYWQNQWNVLEMDEGCSLEVSDSLNCPRGIVISTNFKETLYRRHAQIDTPPLINPPLVILAQRDCTIALHYIVSPIKIKSNRSSPVVLKPKNEESKFIEPKIKLENDFNLKDFNLNDFTLKEKVEKEKVEKEKAEKRSSLVEKFFLEGVNSGDGLPNYERGARDTLIEALSQAFTLVDQSLDGVDQLNADDFDFCAIDKEIEGVKISENPPPKPLPADYHLTHIHELIAKFICFVTYQYYSPKTDMQMKIIDLENKLRSRVKWLKNPDTRCNDFIFHHFVEETVSTSLAYIDYLLEPGFFPIPNQLRPSPELSTLAPIIEDSRITHPASSATSESPYEDSIKTPIQGVIDGKKEEEKPAFTTVPPVSKAKAVRDDVIDEIMGKTVYLKPPNIIGFQNLFRHEEQKIKLRHNITDRIRRGYELVNLTNDEKTNAHKHWVKHGSNSLYKASSLGSIKLGEWNAVKLRAEKAARAAKARLEAEAEELARKAELERLERERQQREKEEKERERARIEREKAERELERAEKEKAERAERERARVERVEEEKARRERERIEREERAKAEMELRERLRMEREKLEKGESQAVSSETPIEVTEVEKVEEKQEVPSLEEQDSESQKINVGAAIQMFEKTISKTDIKPPAPKQNQLMVKADFSAMLMEPPDATSAFRRQTYGFNESSSLARTLENPDNKPKNEPVSTFGGFSSFATGGGSLADIAQKASGSGLSDYCTPGSFGSFGSFGTSAFSTGITSKGFTDTGFGQGGFKGFTSSGGFGEAGPKTFSQTSNQGQSGPPSQGDLWNKPRMANPLN